MTRPQVGDIIRFGEYGTAQAQHVLDGYTIGTDDGIIEGTMPNNGIVTITPNTSDQTLEGFYASGSKVIGDVDLVAANILAGKNIFGVSGTAKSFASGNYTVTSSELEFYNLDNVKNQYKYVNVTGLNFTPTLVIIYFLNGNYNRPISFVFNNSIYKYDGRIVITDTSSSTQDPHFFRLYGNAFINQGGFQLPLYYVQTGYETVGWIAQG